jgi:hypothetical protein
VFGAVSWTLWLNRNDLVFKFVSFLQHWAVTSMGPNREGLEQLIESLTMKMDGGWMESGVG